MLSVYVYLAWFICCNAQSCSGVLNPPDHIVFQKNGLNNCGWQIAGVTAFMRVTFTSVNMTYDQNCKRNYVAIYGGDTTSSIEIKRLCGHYASQVSFYSNSGRMHVLLKTENSTDVQGFSANFTSLARISRGDACGGDKIDVARCELGTACVNSTNGACSLDSSTCTCKRAGKYCGSGAGSPTRPCASGTVCMSGENTRCSENDKPTDCVCKDGAKSVLLYASNMSPNPHDVWETVFSCGDTYDYFKTKAPFAQGVRMCSEKGDPDCVTLDSKTLLARLRKNGSLQTNARTCDSACVKESWSGPDSLLAHLTRKCKPESRALYHACNNRDGLHIISSKCTWRDNKLKPVTIQFLRPTIVYKSGNCGGNTILFCSDGTVCLNATNALCLPGALTPDCICKSLVHSGGNCGGGTDSDSQVCTTGNICWAVGNKCPRSASVEECTCNPVCTRPKTLTGYNLENVNEDDLTIGSFAVSTITCATGYSGEANAHKCDSAGAHYVLSGCTQMCTRPGNLTGYNLDNVNEEDRSMGSFRVSNITCATGYSGEANAHKCDSAGAHYELRGCTQNPKCDTLQDENACNSSKQGHTHNYGNQPCFWCCGRNCISGGSKCEARGYLEDNYSHFNGICPYCTNSSDANGTGIISGTGDCEWSLVGMDDEVIRLFITTLDFHSSKEVVSFSDGTSTGSPPIVPTAQNVYSSQKNQMFVQLRISFWNGAIFSANYSRIRAVAVDVGGRCNGNGYGPLPCVSGTTCATSANQLCLWREDAPTECTCKYVEYSDSYCGGGNDKFPSVCEAGYKCVAANSQTCPFGFDVAKCFCKHDGYSCFSSGPHCGRTSGCTCEPRIASCGLGRNGSFSSNCGKHLYEPDADYGWLIQGEENDIIQLSFTRFKLEEDYDFVTLYDGPNKASVRIMRRSGSGGGARTYSTSRNQMYVHLETDDSGQATGFSANFVIVHQPTALVTSTVEPTASTIVAASQWEEFRKVFDCRAVRSDVWHTSLAECKRECLAAGCNAFNFHVSREYCSILRQCRSSQLEPSRIADDEVSYRFAPAPATTTVAPAVVVPTTVAPTVVVLTTDEPTAVVTTSVEPTVVVLTTDETTAVVTTTVEPTTVVSITVEPTVVVPTTVEPTVVVPTSVEPTVVVPTTVEPTVVVLTTNDSANTSANNVFTIAEGYDDTKMLVVVLLVVAGIFVSVFMVSYCRSRDDVKEDLAEEI